MNNEMLLLIHNLNEVMLSSDPCSVQAEIAVFVSARCYTANGVSIPLCDSGSQKLLNIKKYVSDMTREIRKNLSDDPLLKVIPTVQPKIIISEISELLNTTTAQDKKPEYWEKLKQRIQIIQSNAPNLMDQIEWKELLSAFQEIVFHANIDKASWGSTVQEFYNRLCVVPVTTAECERHFSDMNYIKNARRNRLDIKKVRDLMLCRRYGLPPQHFDPTDFVVLWIKDGKKSSFVKKRKADQSGYYSREDLNNEEEMLVRMVERRRARL